MTRHLAAIAFVLCVSQAPLYSQTVVFTVTSAPADVQKSPSIAAPVIGKAPSGTSLPVTRELGSWVKVQWPAAEDGVGYIHVSRGRISDGSQRSLSALNQTGQRTTSISSISGRTAPSSSTTGGDNAAGVQQAVSTTAQSVNSIQSGTPTAHLIGIGGRMGSTPGLGASARAAVSERFAIQLELSRYSPTTVVAQERLTSMQFAPSLLYSLPDKLTDYVWVRPYVGGGMTFYRSTLSSGIPGVASLTDSGMGRQLFGGTAVSFASAPQFTLSVDYGWRWFEKPVAPLALFGGVDLGGRGLSVSGHWYVK